MNPRVLLLTVLTSLAAGCLWDGLAAEAKPKPHRASPEPLFEPQSFGRTRERHFTGTLTLEKAVEIALRQNPDILNSIQEIERTRGLIIEVRAAALPHLTLTGDYEQDQRRLIEGGGFARSSTASSSLLSSGSLASSGSSLPASETGNTNSTGNTVITGGTTATGSGGTGTGTGGTPVRTPRRQAVDTAIGGTGTTGTTGATTTTTTGDSSSGDLSAVLQQLEDSSGLGSSVQNKSWSVTVQVSQAIYTGGQVTAAIRIAKFTQDSAYFQLRDVVDRIISEVREQFYLVLLNRSLINVAEEAVRLAKDQLTDQQNRFDAGTVPRFNVLRAEVEVANEEPNLIRAKNDYLLAQIQLSKRLGLDPGPNGQPEFNAQGELAVSRRHISLVDAISLAHARRPYLKIQRQNILIDTEQIKIELAGYKPRIDAHAGYEFRNRSTSEDLTDVVNGWFFGATGSWAIFDGFETFGRVKQARARLEQSKITYDDAVREVDLEVQTAFANLEQARQTVESQQKNVEQALEAVRLAQERFSAGAGTQLEILDARVALTRARTTELQSRSDFNRDLAELDRATATDTKYDDTFHDPLAKVEKGIFSRLANTGLPKHVEPADTH